MNKVKIFLLIFFYVILSGQASNALDLCPLYDFPGSVKYVFYERQSYDGGKTTFVERKCDVEMRTKEINREKYISIQYKTWDHKVKLRSGEKDFDTLLNKLTIRKLLLENEVLWKPSINDQPADIANLDSLFAKLDKLRGEALNNNDLAGWEKSILEANNMRPDLINELEKIGSLYFNGMLCNRELRLGKNEDFSIFKDIVVLLEQEKYKLSYRMINDRSTINYECILDGKTKNIVRSKSTFHPQQKKDAASESSAKIEIGDHIVQMELLSE